MCATRSPSCRNVILAVADAVRSKSPDYPFHRAGHHK